MSPGEPTISGSLLGWFDGAARDLPWRRSNDPYQIWVSEIMLQQTRVETVIPYFERFTRRFPSVSALAEAPLEQVLQEWSGLGYYRRARQLHLAAAEVVERYGGRLPADAQALRGLSGVGRYTAGAIASIAFGLVEPLVDGNVVRVLARVFALDDDMRAAKGLRKVWQLAQEQLPSDRPGAFNEALMELGATVCLPRAALCARCPLASTCQAHARGIVDQLPKLPAKKRPTRQPMVAVVLSASGGRALLAQRQEEGLFGGLWEPPMVPGSELADARQALQIHGVRPRLELERVGKLRHALTHRTFEVVVAGGKVARVWRLPDAASGGYQTYGWLKPDAVPLSTLARKVLAAAAG